MQVEEANEGGVEEPEENSKTRGRKAKKETEAMEPAAKKICMTYFIYYKNI